MRMANKIISAIISVAFLINTVGADLALGQTVNFKPNVDKLAPPSNAEEMERAERGRRDALQQLEGGIYFFSKDAKRFCRRSLTLHSFTGC